MSVTGWPQAGVEHHRAQGHPDGMYTVLGDIQGIVAPASTPHQGIRGIRGGSTSRIRRHRAHSSQRDIPVRGCQHSARFL